MSTTPRPSRKLIVILSGVSISLFGALAAVLELARQDSATHYNLSYLLWKGGLKNYEASVALPGMTHDHKFRDGLVGISPAEFEKRFPATFYEVQSLPPIAKPGERYFINDYHQSRSEDAGFSFVWLAVFKKNQLATLEISKP